MAIREGLLRVLTAPTAAELWGLRGDLLEAGLPADAPLWPVLGEFQRYLDTLATSTSSREASHLASMLDIGAIGGVVIEDLLEADGDELALRLLGGVVSEGLMTLATRQHVRAWAGELAAVYRQAAWYLYEELWRWSATLKSELSPGERRRLLDQLLSPVHDDETPEAVKAALLGRLFQVLLVSYVTRSLAAPERPA